jgi:hypothetical protein
VRKKRQSKVEVHSTDVRAMVRAAEGNAPARVVTYRTSGRTFTEYDKSNVVRE